MELVLDVQGFGKFSEKFVVKELAAIYINTPGEIEPSLTRVLFKSPCSWITLSREHRNLNTWLMQNYHGIPWTAGDTPYKDVANVVKKIVEDACYILVKGIEKKRWVEEIINDSSKVVIDLEALDCPNLRILRCEYNAIRWHGDCHGHVAGYRCAFENVQRLRGWYVKECTASTEKSLCIYIQAGSLERMRAVDIAFLTKQFILIYGSNIIDVVWDKLSVAMQNDEDIASHRLCRLHHSSPDPSLPGPDKIKNCVGCKLSK